MKISLKGGKNKMVKKIIKVKAHIRRARPTKHFDRTHAPVKAHIRIINVKKKRASKFIRDEYGDKELTIAERMRRLKKRRKK